MSLLKKMAQAAIRKAFLSKVIGGAPTDIKSSIEELCACGPCVDALQHYATQTSKEAGKYPLTPALVEEMALSPEQRERITKDPAILCYLNGLLAEFQ